MNDVQKAVNQIIIEHDLNDMERDFLINDIIEDYIELDDAKTYMIDILQHGCISGVVPYLIYNHDVMKFLSKYSYEIEEELLEIAEYEPDVGEFNGFVYMVWRAFEHAVAKVYWYFEGASRDVLIEKYGEE